MGDMGVGIMVWVKLMGIVLLFKGFLKAVFCEGTFPGNMVMDDVLIEMMLAAGLKWEGW